MAKKIPLNVVSLTEIKSRCPSNQIEQLKIFFAKNRKYQEYLMSLPKGLPKIDWDFYRRNVRSESVAMVNEFQKKYESFSVPYPEDIYSKQIDDIKTVVKVDIEEYKKQSNKRIAMLEKKIEAIKSTIPYSEMTWEDYCCLYPNEAPDFINCPTFWPHNKEEQIGYEEEEDNKKKTKLDSVKVVEATKKDKIKTASKETPKDTKKETSKDTAKDTAKDAKKDTLKTTQGDTSEDT